LRILKKYRKGRDIDLEDEEIVDKLALISLMKTGISVKRKKRTARTIGIGKKLIE